MTTPTKHKIAICKKTRKTVALRDLKPSRLILLAPSQILQIPFHLLIKLQEVLL